LVVVYFFCFLVWDFFGVFSLGVGFYWGGGGFVHPFSKVY